MREGTPQEREWERQVPQEVGGPSPQPALKEALLPGVHNKRRKIIQPGEGRGPAVPFIHNIVNIHGLYYMCFSLVFACLSVHLSVWGLDLRSLAGLLPHSRLHAPPWKQNLKQVWSPILAGASRQGLGLSPYSGLESCVCACVCVRVCACMYTGNLCASMYKGGSCHRRSRWGSRQACLGWLAHK